MKGEVVGYRSKHSANQSPETCLRRRPGRKNTKKKCGEQRSVEEREQKLQIVHQAVVTEGNIGRHNTEETCNDSRQPANQNIMSVRSVWLEVRFIEIVRPEC